MTRIVLTLYLMAAITAGPWLCCCTAAQVAALGSPGEQTAPVPARPPCCCESPQDGDEKAATESRGPRQRPCPCNEHRPAAVVLAAAQNVSAKHAAPQALPDVTHAGLDGVTVLPGTCLPAPDRAAALPLTCRDILSRLHVLRC